MTSTRSAPAEDVALPLGLYNYGHFTSMVVTSDMAVKGLALHLARLTQDCRQLFGAALDTGQVLRACREAVAQGPTVARVTVSDPELELAQPEQATRPVIVVTTRPMPALPASPLRVQARCYLRDLPTVKHVGLFGSVTHRRQARLAGFDDALFVDDRRHVIEGATWSLLAIRDGTALWPDGDKLLSVTVDLMEDVLRRAGLRVETTAMPVDDLHRMRAVYALNSVVGLRAISAVDGHSLSRDEDLERRLRAAYDAVPDTPL